MLLTEAGVYIPIMVSKHDQYVCVHGMPTVLLVCNAADIISGQDGPRNMAVVDVFRDRERGMVRYNQARRQYGIKPAETFEDITDNAEVVT